MNPVCSFPLPADNPAKNTNNGLSCVSKFYPEDTEYLKDSK